ncbi:MAG: hypothetical protein ACRDZX_09175 [Acidimicrobiales bacterium]
MVRSRWLTRRAFALHFLLVTVVPACLLAGWWQVHRALSGNLLSYFYSIEWPIFGVLGVIAWWQLVHDDRTGVTDGPRQAPEPALDDEAKASSSPPLVWDKALETPELIAYNSYLHTLAAGRARKTWRNPRGLPADVPESPAGAEEMGAPAHAGLAGQGNGAVGAPAVGPTAL